MAGPFTLRWLPEADARYRALKAKSQAALASREKSKKPKASKDEGLFKQVHKTLEHLKADPRHPGLQTHEYDSLSNPFDSHRKVFEAYAQNQTSSAYRVFWCYGPGKGELTIIAITRHP
jgi:hypothetical protein